MNIYPESVCNLYRTLFIFSCERTMNEKWQLWHYYIARSLSHSLMHNVHIKWVRIGRIQIVLSLLSSFFVQTVSNNKENVFIKKETWPDVCVSIKYRTASKYQFPAFVYKQIEICTLCSSSDELFNQAKLSKYLNWTMNLNWIVKNPGLNSTCISHLILQKLCFAMHEYFW